MKSSVGRHMDASFAWYQQCRREQRAGKLNRFGTDNFRVLFAVGSPEPTTRIRSMLQRNQTLNHGTGSGIFLFAPKVEVTPERFLVDRKVQDCTGYLAAPWLSGMGELTTLVS